MVTLHATTPVAWSRAGFRTTSNFNIAGLNKLFLRDGWVNMFLSVQYSGGGSGDMYPGVTMLLGSIPEGFRPQFRVQGVVCDTARTSPAYIDPNGSVYAYSAQGKPFQKDIPIQLVFPPYPAAN